MSLGGRIKEFAQKYYGSSTALADAAGIDKSQLSKYITGVSTPTFDVMVRLHHAGMSLDWAASGRGNMVADPNRVEVLERLLTDIGNSITKALRGEISKG